MHPGVFLWIFLQLFLLLFRIAQVAWIIFSEIGCLAQIIVVVVVFLVSYGILAAVGYSETHAGPPWRPFW